MTSRFYLTVLSARLCDKLKRIEAPLSGRKPRKLAGTKAPPPTTTKQNTSWVTYLRKNDFDVCQIAKALIDEWNRPGNAGVQSTGEAGMAATCPELFGSRSGGGIR